VATAIPTETSKAAVENAAEYRNKVRTSDYFTSKACMVGFFNGQPTLFSSLVCIATDQVTAYLRARQSPERFQGSSESSSPENSADDAVQTSHSRVAICLYQSHCDCGTVPRTRAYFGTLKKKNHRGPTKAPLEIYFQDLAFLEKRSLVLVTRVPRENFEKKKTKM
jgi:hypothetical protein